MIGVYLVRTDIKETIGAFSYYDDMRIAAVNFDEALKKARKVLGRGEVIRDVRLLAMGDDNPRS